MQGSLQTVFDFITNWYLKKFMPTGLAASDYTITNPLTKALLFSPLRAAGGLGLPCYELIYFRRRALFPNMMVHANKYPWILESNNYCNVMQLEFNPTSVVVEEEEEEDEESAPSGASTYDQLQLYWAEYGRVMYYPEGSVTDWEQRRVRYVTGAKWRNTSFLRYPPEQRHHKLENETFRHFLAVTACFAPGLSIPAHCTGIALPRRDLISASTKQSDVLDHVLHCSSCSGKALVFKHNNVNHALARTFAHFGIPYTQEPKGLPKRNVNEYHKLRGKDGPDGICQSLDGITVVEIHCTHQRYYHKEAEKAKYCSIGASRAIKKCNYATFSSDYPGINCEVFSVSSGGVIHKDTLKWVQTKMAPLASLNQGVGLMKMLTTEVAFAVAKASGSVLQLVKLQKNSLR
jgi:hypothetical protein